MNLPITIFFDLDGTLVDSFDQIVHCVQKVRSKMQMTWRSDLEISRLIGLPAEHFFKDQDKDGQNRAISEFRNELLEKVNTDNTVYPGAVDLLEELRNQGIKTAVVTSKPHYLAVLVVKNSELNGLIHLVQGVDGFAPKPDPEGILRCQSKLPAKKYVMVGDRPEDIQAGLASGCLSVGIAQGNFGQGELKRSGAHFTFSNITEISENLGDFLDRILKHES